MGNCLELLLQPDRSSGGFRWWWSAPVASPPPPSQRSNLAPEVAGMVLHRLPAGGVDHVRFASLPLPLPLLALPDGTVRGLLDGKPLPFPRCAGYAGACGDWLVFSRGEDGGAAAQLVVVDPFSGTTMTLPALSSVRVQHDVAGMEIQGPMEMAVCRVICCSPHLIATHVRLGDHCAGIAVCRPGATTSRWSVRVDQRVSGFDDYALYQGKLYAVDYPGGGLFSIDVGVDHDTGDLRVSQIQLVIGDAATDGTPFRGDDYVGEMLYLVESCGGELLMVRRVISGRWVAQNTQVHDAARRNEFQVFEADFERSRWTEARTIGDDQVLFLRQRCSKSVCVSQSEMNGDLIFFLENVDEDQTWYSKESPSCCSVYDVRNGRGTMALPMEVSWSPGTAATWLFPKDSSDAPVVEGDLGLDI